MGLLHKNIQDRHPFIKSQKFPYIVFGLFFLLIYLFINPNESGFLMGSYRILIIIAIFTMVIWGIYLYLTKKLSVELCVSLLILIGALIRLSYVLYTPWHIRQHDLGDVDTEGHMSYIYYISNYLSLPDTNYRYFSHPPLHHVICGLFYYVNDLLNVSKERIQEGMQLITAFYSCCIMVVSYRIFKCVKLTGVFLITAMSIICLHPTFIILGGSLNNDVLMVLFIFSSILWLFKWYGDPSLYHIVFLAINLGLAMMSKISASTLAFVIAPVFLMKMFSVPKPWKQPKLFLQFLTFGFVSIPIGMWYPIRNLLLFGQRFNYVIPFEESNPLYCGYFSNVERFLTLPIAQLTKGIYCIPVNDYNLPIYILKCSIFGEYSYNGDVASLSVTLLIFNALIILLSLLAMVYVMLYEKRQACKPGKVVLFLVWIIQIVFFLYFNIQYPFGCSMDFRYIVPTLLTGSGFIGMAGKSLSHQNPKLWMRIKIPVYSIVAGFCVFSSLLFLFL